MNSHSHLLINQPKLFPSINIISKIKQSLKCLHFIFKQYEIRYWLTIFSENPKSTNCYLFFHERVFLHALSLWGARYVVAYEFTLLMISLTTRFLTSCYFYKWKIYRRPSLFAVFVFAVLTIRGLKKHHFGAKIA